MSTKPPVEGRTRRGRARSGQSIIGFTEAELGLFLAVLFLGLNFIGRTTGLVGGPRSQVRLPDSLSRANPRIAQLVTLSQRLDSLERALAAAQARDRELATRMAELERQRDSLRLVAIQPRALPTPPAPAATRRIPASPELVERRLTQTRVEQAAVAAQLVALRRQVDSARVVLLPLAQAVAVPGTPTKPGATEAASAATLLAATRPSQNTAPAVATPASPAAPVPPAPSGNPAGTPGQGRVGRSIAIVPGATGDEAGAGGANGFPGLPGTPGEAGGAGATAGSGGSGRGAEAAAARSRQTPTCVELGAARGVIADITILGADRYGLRGTTGSLQTVLTVLRPQLDTARRRVCRQRVRVRSAARLLVEDYIPAVNALLPYFNTELARDSASASPRG